MYYQALYSALYELARQPGYIHSLREEVKSMLAEYGPTVSGCNRMVLLDSFLKECQRLHPPAASMLLSLESLNSRAMNLNKNFFL